MALMALKSEIIKNNKKKIKKIFYIFFIYI